uniref:Uncharacterized protein n=1 Tax=Rhizophora mucronata TaxID=61149 RepID=A0A2P2NT88_RHIMU
MSLLKMILCFVVSDNEFYVIWEVVLGAYLFLWGLNAINLIFVRLID